MNWAEWNKEMEVAYCLSLNKWIDQYSNRSYLNKVEGLTVRSVTWNRLPIKILLMDWNSSVVWKIVFCISQSTLLDRFFLDTTALVVNFPLLRHIIHFYVQLLVHWCLIQPCCWKFSLSSCSEYLVQLELYLLACFYYSQDSKCVRERKTNGIQWLQKKILKKGFVHSGKHQCNGNIFHLNYWLRVRHFVVMNNRKEVIADFAQ